MENPLNLHFTPELQYLCLKSVFAQAMEYQGYRLGLLKLRVGFELNLLVTENLPVIKKSESIMPFFNMSVINSGGGSDTEYIFKNNVKIKPVIVLVDVYYLPFRQEYKKNHASHAVFFWDYNEAEQKVFVIDWYAPHFFMGYISESEFKKARSSLNQKNENPFSGDAINNVWFAFPSIDELPDSKEVYRLNGQSIFKEENFQNIKSGIPAIRYLKQYFLKAAELQENTCRDLCRYFHEELFIYYRTCIFSTLYFSLAYNEGISSSAIMMQHFCKQSLTVLDQINYLLLKGVLRNSKEKIMQCYLRLEELEHLYINAKMQLSGL